MASSDLIVAVSQSTESDIRIYFPELAHIPSIVAPLAPCTELPQSCADPHFIEPYVAILGTLEPRKNVEFVFDYLSRNRRLLESVAFVFIGRFGWGNSADQLLDRYQLRPLFEKRRVRFTGFVSDAVRDQLIANARAVVYPSRYEGFGLPVLEALACGVPVITTLNSSMPEAGGTLASYFDVGNQEQFAAAVETALQETSPGSAAIRGDLVAKRKAWSARFTWRQSYLTIRDAALQALAQGSRQGPLVGESQSARAESHMRPSP